jgi:uncharacterized protein YecT (DUF1311 family)
LFQADPSKHCLTKGDMRGIIPFLTIVTCLLFGAPSLFGQSQMEMNTVAETGFLQADARLNSVYKKLLSAKADDKEFCENLRQAQRAWITFVDFHMKTLFPLKKGEDPRIEYGSIYPLEYYTEKSALFKERIKQLKSILEGGP